MLKNNQKVLDNIVQVSLSIKTLYDKLYELDKNNLKDSNEYKKTLDYLKIALECEANYYSQIGEYDLNSIISNVEFKLCLIDGKNHDIILENINSNNNHKLKYIRILSRLYNMKNSSIYDSELNTDKIVLKFDNNLINYYFMQLMNFYIKGSDFNNSVLFAKYNLSFLVNNLEKENVGSNFNDRNLVCFDENDDLNNDGKYIKFSNNVFYGTDREKILVVSNIMNIINKMLSFSDEQFDDVFKTLIFKIYSFYIRSCFNYLNDDYIISNLNERFHDFVDSYEYHIKFGSSHSKAISLIRETFSKINKDKQYISGKVYKLNM